jgi:hypothetical protein
MNSITTPRVTPTLIKRRQEWRRVAILNQTFLAYRRGKIILTLERKADNLQSILNKHGINF